MDIFPQIFRAADLLRTASICFLKTIQQNLSIVTSKSRSSHRRYPVGKDVLRNFAKFTGKHLCQSFFLIKLQTEACNFVKRLWHRCFLVNFAKALRTSFLLNTSERLYLEQRVLKAASSKQWVNSSGLEPSSNSLFCKLRNHFFWHWQMS